MTTSQSTAGLRPRRRRLRRIAGSALAALVVLGLVAVGLGSWVGSSLLLDPHHQLLRDSVQVEQVGGGRVVLEHTHTSARQGTYGLDWPRGHAIVGDVVAVGPATVTRELRQGSGSLSAGTKVAIDPDVWTTDPRTALGIAFTDVAVADPLGPMPAWQVTGRGSTWVIFVHGIDGSRAGGLRPLGTLHQAQLPTLLISYRNDVRAPPSPDGLIHLGMTEWQDLDAAAAYALAHGAEHLVLYGDSMGGAIVMRFMTQSERASRVVGLVLDAPVLDWASVLDRQAARFHLPFLAGPIQWMISRRIQVSWPALDALTTAGYLGVPVLLFQGLDDQLVAPATSETFAARVPHARATYVPVAGAGHIESWNVNPGDYERHLAAFLARLGLNNPSSG